MSGTTISATFDNVGFCGTSNEAPGVWYTIVGDGSLFFIASTCNAASFDTKISVFSGKCDDLVCVVGNHIASGCTGSGITSDDGFGFLTTEGTVYSILVHGYGSETGYFDLIILPLGVSARIESSLFEGVGSIR
jgi:hypothetical protein